MRLLLCVLSLLLCTARIGATPLVLDGKLDWEITEPRCEFELDGTLRNLTLLGSGTIKLVLWATRDPFPSAGYVIAEARLGQINAGSKIRSFKIKTTSDLPEISGDYYFTVAITEYTITGWRNVGKSDSKIRKLQNGDFANQAKWKFPNQPITEPLLSLAPKNVLRLTAAATGELNQFPIDSQDQSKLTILKESKVTVSNRADKKPVTYRYRTKWTKLGNNSARVGSLNINYGKKDDDVSKTNLTLYFQGTNFGTYESQESGSAKETIWGSFTIR